MRMLVIGSSDTSGITLANPGDAWPNLVGGQLSAAIGEEVEVENLPLVPSGPKALPRVEKALEKHDPDLVVFSFGGYHFLVGTVGNRVRRRYGDRAYKFFRKLEVRFESKTENKAGGSARLNRAGRWLARHVIGAEPLSTREEVTSVELEVMRTLSQRENLTVVILYAPPLAESLSRENHNANAILDDHREEMNAHGRSFHFLIADCVPGFEAARADLRHSDGVHKGPAGHRIQAASIMKALLEAPSPYARSANLQAPV
ncbi:MAG: hypothetical protein AB7N24_10300 [Dehalococcoidia bacterium]